MFLGRLYTGSSKQYWPTDHDGGTQPAPIDILRSLAERAATVAECWAQTISCFNSHGWEFWHACLWFTPTTLCPLSTLIRSMKASVFRWFACRCGFANSERQLYICTQYPALWSSQVCVCVCVCAGADFELLYVCNVLFCRPQVVKGSEILEILHGEPDVREFVFSLYECRYADFFKALGESLPSAYRKISWWCVR